MESTKKTALDKARETCQERMQKYGSPKPSFERVAQVWSGILGTEVSPEQVSMCMIGLKMVRECYAHQEDNLIDMAGYVEVLDCVINDREP